MNIKKQLRNLYLYEIISGFQIVDAVWVLFLLGRGFSLTQAGLAEGFFHMVSMCCEIPSGMLSDMIGRRKTLILAGLISAAGAFCMIVTDWFWVILIAMGLNAFSYNLVSGTREALTYDSLLECGQEAGYLKVSSIQENLYLGIFALTNCMSVVTVALGYRNAYLIAVAQGILSSLVALRLCETQAGRKEKREGLTLKDMKRELKSYAEQSVNFLRGKSSGMQAYASWWTCICRVLCYLYDYAGAFGCLRIKRRMDRDSLTDNFPFQHGGSNFGRKNRKNKVEKADACRQLFCRSVYYWEQQFPF